MGVAEVCYALVVSGARGGGGAGKKLGDVWLGANAFAYSYLGGRLCVYVCVRERG